MPASRRLRSLATASVVAAAVALGSPRARAEPPDVAAATAALSDPRWEIRRAAEAQLEAEGLAIVEGGVAAERERAWERALDDAIERGGSPAAAVHRLLRRLEARADDAQVARCRRLLRSRLERMLPQVVRPRTSSESDGGGGADEGAAAAARSIRGLLPEARPALLAILAAAADAREVAAAIVVLCGEDGAPPDGDDVLEALREGYDRAPARMERLRDFRAPRMLPPAAALGLALAVVGRGADVARLRERGVLSDANDTFDTWLRAYVRRHGIAELDAGSFLMRMEEGSARPAVETEAARRALAADVPWLARLLARRATFLAADDAAARDVLASAYEKVGLGATAKDVRGRARGDDDRDDPRAAALDQSLAAGRLSSRIVLQREAGETDEPGLAPIALAGDRLYFGTASGALAVTDVAHDEDLTFVGGPGATGLPVAVATAGARVAVLTRRFTLRVFHREDDGSLRSEGGLPGPYDALAAGPEDTLWVVATRRRVWRIAPGRGAEPCPKVERIDRFRPTSVSVTDDGRLVLLAARGGVSLVDPVTGATTELVAAEQHPVRAAAFGREVLVAFTDGWVRLAADGKELHRTTLEDGGPVTGIGGDPKAATVVVVTPESTTALSPDGAVRWQEQIGGSGDPVVAGDLVAVSAGTGAQPAGDNRTDRTIYVLRSGVASLDPFPAEARVRAVEAAVAAVVADRDDVAEALLDPLAGWLSPRESWAAQNALREARSTREARRAAPHGDGAAKPPDDGRDDK